MFCLIDFSILSVNCSHVCIILVKICEKISSGGLEVSLSIGYRNVTLGQYPISLFKVSLKKQESIVYYWK